MDIGIPDPARKDVALGLCRLLADSYALYLKIHGFHWNVTGPSFQTLHLMFMGQ
ncbi:MAG TPA: ferritin-like domain-containing protein, partial [Myxococcota bacterium]|nr:ferritin-like domain-containing protein [Myxococcota bacterium]